MSNKRHPLEIGSWIAGIVSAAVALYLLLPNSISSEKKQEPPEIEGGTDIELPEVIPMPTNPIPPDIKVKIFSHTSGSAQHPRVKVDVPNDYKIIGGGAMVNWSGHGNLLTSMYPESLNTWVASSKDHTVASPATITGYAIAIHDPEDEWEVKVFSSTSSSSAHPRASVNVPDTFVMTGGGARVHWSGYGNLLTASFPSNKFSWEVRSKDHGVLSHAPVTAYAIGLRPRNKAALPESHVFATTGGVTAHPSSQVAIDNGYILTGGGALNNWGGYGSLLTSSYPEVTSTWKASGKNHNVSDPAAITTYAIGLKK